MTAVKGAPQPVGTAGGAALKTCAFVGVTAFFLGVLTSFGQTWLPDEARSLANSAGSWALLAFLLALSASSAWIAAVCGAQALLALVAGYFIASLLRDFAVSRAVVVFWTGAAVVVGPALGIGAFLLRRERGTPAALALGSISGVLVGEGVYGLRYIADTTYPPLWWAEVLTGLAVLSVGALTRLHRTTAGAVATAWALVVAVAFVALYARGGFVLG